MKWSVDVVAEGDRVLSQEEVVEFADAVASLSGIASGIGTNRYGAQLLIEADSRDDAIERASAAFTGAATLVGMPAWPIASVRATSEAEDEELGWPE